MAGPIRLPSNLGDLVRWKGAMSRLALIDERIGEKPQAITAGDLHERVCAFARGLRRRGLGPGDAVGFLSENRSEFLVGYLGTMYAGSIAVPINFKLSRVTIEHIIKDAGVRLVFYDEGRSHLVPPDGPAICLDGPGYDGFEAFLDPGPMDPFDPPADHIAEILYTSGSSGAPKGVPLTHGGQLWVMSNYVDPPGSPMPEATTIVVAPFYHMNGLVFSSLCLLNGLRIVLLPAFDAALFLDAVYRHRCPLLSGVPTMFSLLARLPEDLTSRDFSFVTRIMLGSAPLSEELYREIARIFPNADVTNSYGTTEIGAAIFGPHPDGMPRPPLSLGYPLASVDWKLVGGEAPDQGVLHVKTPALMSGYLNRPDADAERFSSGWFNTNDVMRRDADGFMYFVSRADDMFVCGGENIYPGVVEELLEGHPEVFQAAVVPVEDSLKGHIPVAFVVPAPGKKVTAEEIKAYALENGPAYAHPRTVVVRETLPVSGTHKIDRKVLAAEAIKIMKGIKA